MDQGACVGCRTSFFEAESLPLDSAATEYRDFDIPIKNDSSRWILLKDIVSFLNSRGGTIYIGVEQNKGSVKGIFMDWKQRDNFKLQTKQLIEKIYPKVDLNNKQEVLTYTNLGGDSVCSCLQGEQFLGEIRHQNHRAARRPHSGLLHERKDQNTRRRQRH